MASKRDALIASAEKFLQKGKVDAALKDYLKVLEETPKDINILNKVGDLFVRLNRNEESIPYFQRIAEHFAVDGFYLKAIAIYRKINRFDPSRLDVYEKLAELYSKQGLLMEAKSQYQVLADYYTKQDNVGGAIAIYQKMVGSEPANIQLHVKLADLFTQSKKIADALKEYTIVASMLRNRNAIDESVQVFEKALKIAPDNVDILKTFVPMLLDAGRVDVARGVLKKALETTPRSVPLFVLAADAASAANDMAEARSFSAKGQAVDPENEEVLACVVRIQLKGRRPDLAFAAAAPLADIAVKRGEPKKAFALLAQIAKATPDNEDVLKKTADVALAAGDEKGAVPYRSALAEIWRKQGKVVEAADALRICMRLAPDVAEFRARLAQLEPLLPASASATGTLRAAEAPVAEGPVSFPGVPAKQAPPPRSAPPPTLPIPSATKPDEFEFDLADEELVEEATPLSSAEPTPPPAVRRSFGEREAPPPSEMEFTPEEAREKTSPGIAMPGRPALSTAPTSEWGIGNAADAIAQFEAREAAARMAPAAPPSEVEEAEELLEISEAAEVEASTEIPQEPVRRPISFEMRVSPPTAARPAPAEVTEADVDEALVESEVFRKYGLLEKAVEQVKGLIKRAPESIRAREKLFELYLEQGKKASARKEADTLKERYLADGREDRVRAMERLLGEEPVAAAPAPPAPPPPPAVEPSKPAPHLQIPGVISPPPLAAPGKFKKVRADDIQIPLPPVAKPAKPRVPASPLPQIELPEELLIKPKPLPAAASVPPPDLLADIAPPPMKISAESVSLDDIGALERLAPPAQPRKFAAAAPGAPPASPPVVEPAPLTPTADEISRLDFCLEQGMVVDAAEQLQMLEEKYPDNPDLRSRRSRLEGTKAPVGEQAGLHDLLTEDLESVLDAELGRALTDEMAKESTGAGKGPPSAPPPASSPAVDESGLFSDEAEFFNFAEELQTEMKTEAPAPTDPTAPGGEVSLEEIFREFKKGVEQQLSPEDYETHYNLGIAYKEMMLTDEAIGEFQLAAKDPNHAVECCSMLGLCFLEKGLPQLAIKWYKKGLEAVNIKEDDRLGLQYDLASVYLDVGDKENAYKTFLDIYGSNASYRDVGDRLKELGAA